MQRKEGDLDEDGFATWKMERVRDSSVATDGHGWAPMHVPTLPRPC